MDLNIEERFTPEEIIELRKRVFSFADQMLTEGISIGRELSREQLFSDTERFIKDKLSAMTSYFIDDKMWKIMPPMGYNPDPAVDIPQPTRPMEKGYAKAIKDAENPLDKINRRQKVEKPQWVIDLENGKGKIPMPDDDTN